MNHFLPLKFRRCAYHANVMNAFEQTNNTTVLKIIVDLMFATVENTGLGVVFLERS
jgi:hypothetical protein